jgi:hypothetical protein
MYFHFLRASLLVGLALAPQLRGADSLALSPCQGVLLLNNGHVIEGTITAAGDRYDVVRQDVEIRVKRSEVSAVCQNLLECYHHKRTLIEADRVLDHLELMDWCLQHKLLEPAETELACARALDPQHPRIRLLEPRLALAKAGPAKLDAAAAVDKPATTEQLDKLVRNLPAGSMEMFTNTIQPLLLNYCSKSGCHAARSSSALRFERIPPNRLAGRHTTQHNLAAALTMIDRENPSESKLLQAPIRPHGNLKLPVFTDREQSQYRQLVRWVFLAANAREPAQPTLEERTAPLAQAAPPRGETGDLPGKDSSAAKSPQQSIHPADWSHSFPEHEAGEADAVQAAASVPLGGAARPKQPVASAPFRPKDPFDPAIFNRRFFKQ